MSSASFLEEAKKTVEETSETCLVLFCGVLYGYLFEIAILNIFPVLVCTVGKKICLRNLLNCLLKR